MWFLFQVLVYIVAFKAIMGVRFPWETCSCCGNKMRDHQMTGKNE